MLNINSFWGFSLGSCDCGLEGLKILITDFNLIDLLLDFEGSVDQIEHILREVVRILD